MDIVVQRGSYEALLLTINDMVDNLENRERRLSMNDQYLLNKVRKLRQYYHNQIDLIDSILSRGVDR